MNFQKFEVLISQSRVSRYLAATGGNQRKAQKLYLANLRVAQAFHPLLGLLEITLRNKIDSALSIHFGNPNWILTEVNGFMADPSITKYDKKVKSQVPDHWLKKEVLKAKTRLTTLQTPITVGKIIAEQSFGFWTEFFETKYYRVLLGTPIQAFTGLPSTYGRKEVSQDLNTIRKFRNRINHDEPICFNSQNDLDFSDALGVYSAISNILKWMDTELPQFAKHIDKVKSSIRTAKQLLRWWYVF